MAKLRTLKKLLRLRGLVESQSLQDLEVSVAHCVELELMRGTLVHRQQLARVDFARSVLSGDTPGRTGTLLEAHQAELCGGKLALQREQAELRLARQREIYRLHRIERRQVQTLLDETKVEAEREETHRAQRMLDDWYGRKSRVRSPLPSWARETGLQIGLASGVGTEIASSVEDRSATGAPHEGCAPGRAR